MDIQKKIKEKEEEFQNLKNQREKLQAALSGTNERILILKGEYKMLKEIKQEDINNKDHENKN